MGGGERGGYSDQSWDEGVLVSILCTVFSHSQTVPDQGVREREECQLRDPVVLNTTHCSDRGIAIAGSSLF